jgi:MoaA/NifB/PqqE/SkfB family radical SAM enzyme
MDLAEFRRIVREMVAAGVEEIGLFYLGESLMDPERCIEACRICKEEGVDYVFLTTNGSRCTPDVAEGLFMAGLDSLKFSLNAYDEEQFVEMMGVKAKFFRDSIENLKLACQVRDLGRYPCKISASSIRYDGEQLEKMQKVVDEITPYMTGENDGHYWLPLYSMGSVATEREEELGYKPTAGNQGRIGGLVDPLPCWSLFTEGHVRVDSGFSLCCFDADARFHIASLKDHSFMEVWHHPRFQEAREAHLKGDLTGTVCEECVAYA